MKKPEVVMPLEKVAAILRGWRREMDKPKSKRRSRVDFLKAKRLSRLNLERINTMIDHGAHFAA